MNPRIAAGRTFGRTIAKTGVSRRLGSLMNKVRWPSGRILLPLFAALLVSACGRAPGLSASELNEAYEFSLADTADAAVLPPEQEAAVMERLEAYFTDMTPASVMSETANVYARDAILYDNLAVIVGLLYIEEYFIKASSEADSLSVEFLQVSNDGKDYYVRWRMIIGTEALSPGEPLKSYGVSHFRFNEEGRVILHRDFWDAATGLYEYLPWVGGIVRQLRATLGELPGYEN